MFHRVVTCIFLFIALACMALPTFAVPMPVRVVQAPAGAIAPDVAVDAQGVVHMVYGLGRDAYYVQSRDNGQTFTTPLKLDGEQGVTTTMGERGPKIALGKDTSIHVVWADRWFPGAKELFVRYTRSLDGGKTFETPKTISTPKNGDGVTLTAGTDGQVIAFWHVMTETKPVEKEATWLFQVVSTDNGATFAAPEQMTVTGLAGLACSMCMMRTRRGPGGEIYLVFRNAEKNIRDHYVLRRMPGDTTFTALRVNTDNWYLETCPMTGPELTVDSAGRLLCAFMTDHKVYWAVSDTKRTTFAQHVATPKNEKNEIYPSVYANRAGQVLFLWQVGPMAVNGTATVQWAGYTLDGTFTGEQGTLGTSSSGTKATAFVGADDVFYVVTTAKRGNMQ